MGVGLFPSLFIVLLSLIISYLGVAGVRKWAVRMDVLDVPTRRSSHDTPTPTGGGVGLAGSFLVCAPLVAYFYAVDWTVYGGLLMTAAGIAALGFVDDLNSLSKRHRFGAMIIISLLATFFGVHLRSVSLPLVGELQFGVFSPVVTFVWLIGVANIYNFMDGIDGLAGAEAVCVSGFLAIISALYGQSFVFLFSLILFGASSGFLVHNWHPATIFMGDAGSPFLGFVFASLAVLGSQGEATSIPFVIPVVLLGAFLFDASVTLLRRVPRGKRWLDPHKDHFYQRLTMLGYSHKQVSCLYGGLNALLGGIALGYVYAGERLSMVLLASALVLLVSLGLGTTALESRRTERHV